MVELSKVELLLVNSDALRIVKNSEKEVSKSRKITKRIAITWWPKEMSSYQTFMVPYNHQAIGMRNNKKRKKKTLKASIWILLFMRKYSLSSQNSTPSENSKRILFQSKLRW